MKQEAFVERHEPGWTRFERWLDTRARPREARRATEVEDLPETEVPSAYRRLCQHYAIARRRGYSRSLQDRLHELVLRGHAAFYRPAPPRAQAALTFIVAELPRLFRRHGLAMAVSALLLFGPMVLTIAVLGMRPEYAHTLFDPMELAQFESMYDPDKDRLGRESGSDLRMFGYYVLNNVSIGFRTFASGLVAGVGPVLVLFMNGVIIGGVAGHLTAVGHGAPFWRFVVGHSGPELMAIVIAGGAGLQLGMALLAPGRRSRARALVESGRDGGRLVLGAFLLLVFAAFVEAFWSSIGWMPDPIKYGTGLTLWALILAWLALGGRARAVPG